MQHGSHYGRLYELTKLRIYKNKELIPIHVPVPFSYSYIIYIYFYILFAA